jgi:hypothetical protein
MAERFSPTGLKRSSPPADFRPIPPSRAAALALVVHRLPMLTAGSRRRHGNLRCVMRPPQNSAYAKVS